MPVHGVSVHIHIVDTTEFGWARKLLHFDAAAPCVIEVDDFEVVEDEGTIDKVNRASLEVDDRELLELK